MSDSTNIASGEVIKLDYPVDFEGESFRQLEMRRPKVRDALTAQKTTDSDQDMEIQLFANLCAVDKGVIVELDIPTDYPKLQEVYASMGKPQKKKSEG